MAKTGFIQDKAGNNSSTRLIGLAVIINALLMLWACVIFGFLQPDSFAASVGTGVGLFTGTTTGTFVYLYNNKKKELESLPPSSSTGVSTQADTEK